MTEWPRTRPTDCIGTFLISDELCRTANVATDGFALRGNSIANGSRSSIRGGFFYRGKW